ncbi:BZ3500_MvSof-1268-A1-R1_Chr2-1g04409 [Microbotryum saponariae]|uniref:BZ3500_MvSof-1268-A1-R1_Chr2-1g04409 protein n=1 Tax=Microbotryum saponariae TaxID=289078 RepID=A0A2X0L739_9BASI|nr:BZ3500_MvSof-1268-A1-R1_Chr2-1g04409 [Microbotryum saponariae]SCZ91623.1 BZ3501_MvSof-1269-A2-R1_Chr2-1g04065 [Microbotryum saponariae]
MSQLGDSRRLSAIDFQPVHESYAPPALLCPIHQRAKHPDVITSVHPSWWSYLKSNSVLNNKEEAIGAKRVSVAMYGDQAFNVPSQQAGGPYQSSSDATTSQIPGSDRPWNTSQEDANLTLQALLTQFSTPFGMLGDTNSTPSHQRSDETFFLASSFPAFKDAVPSFASERPIDGLNYPDNNMTSVDANLGFSSLVSQGFDLHQSSLLPLKGSSAADLGLPPTFPSPTSSQPAWNSTQLESFLQSISPYGLPPPPPHSSVPPSQVPLASSSSSSMSGFEPTPLLPVASTAPSFQPTATTSTAEVDAPLLPPSELTKWSNTSTSATTGEASTTRRAKKQPAPTLSGPDLSHLPPSLRAQVAAANRARDAALSNPSTYPTIPEPAPPNATGDLPALSKPWVPKISSADASPTLVRKSWASGGVLRDSGVGTKSATECLAEGSVLGYPTLQSMQDEVNYGVVLKEADFYTSLEVVMSRGGVVVDRNGYRIDGIKVDLFKLFQTVMLQGPGGERVELDQTWPKVALMLGLSDQSQCTQQLSVIYSKVLLTYETAWANALLKQRDKMSLLRRAPTSSSEPGGSVSETPVTLRDEVSAGSGGSDTRRFEEIGPMGFTKDPSM